jgi:hypothetical protein
MRPVLPALILLCGCSSAPSPSPTTRISDPVARIFAELDRDGSGGLGLGELMAHDPKALLPLLDTDRDGAVSLEELRADLNTWPEPRSAQPERPRDPPPGDLPPPVLRPGQQERPEDAKDGPPPRERQP